MRPETKMSTEAEHAALVSDEDRHEPASIDSANGGVGPPATAEAGEPGEAVAGEVRVGEGPGALGADGPAGEPHARDAGGAQAEQATDEGAAPPTATPPAPEADLRALLVEVERQRDDYLDTLRRVQADFDNYRKRVERQRQESADNATAALVRALLPALDTADLALAHGAGEDVKQVVGALFDALAKEGLERIDPEGQAFDPEHHDAVAHEPAQPAEDEASRDGGHQEPFVSEVMRAGYRWRGRVIRPAMVKVRG